MTVGFHQSFHAGRPVTGKDLVGRESIIREIIEYLKSGQSVAIIAPRRYGKTSVILEVLRQFYAQEYFTVYIDLFTTPTIRSLAQRITGDTLKTENWIWYSEVLPIPFPVYSRILNSNKPLRILILS